MKIAVIADTHSQKLPAKLIDELKGVDLILHAGDMCSISVLEDLKKIKNVKAVYGNMDEPSLRQLLPRKQIVHCGKFAIGLWHGEGPPQGLFKKVQGEFKDDKVQAVVFGHSHEPFNSWVDGVLYFNPGSPNDTAFAPYQSYGILEINDAITGKIIKVRS